MNKSRYETDPVIELIRELWPNKVIMEKEQIIPEGQKDPIEVDTCVLFVTQKDIPFLPTMIRQLWRSIWESKVDDAKTRHMMQHSFFRLRLDLDVLLQGFQVTYPRHKMSHLGHKKIDTSMFERNFSVTLRERTGMMITLEI